MKYELTEIETSVMAEEDNLLASFEASLHEVKLIQEGAIPKRTLKEMLDAS